MTQTIIDVIVMLGVTSALGFIVYFGRKLNTLKRMSRNINPSLQSFSNYLEEAEKNITTFQSIIENGQKSLGETVPKAQVLKEEFNVLLEHSEKIAKRLDNIILTAQETEKNLRVTLQDLLLKSQRQKGIYYETQDIEEKPVTSKTLQRAKDDVNEEMFFALKGMR